jgi:hypothetical protein
VTSASTSVVASGNVVNVHKLYNSNLGLTPGETRLNHAQFLPLDRLVKWEKQAQKQLVLALSDRKIIQYTKMCA